MPCPSSSLRYFRYVVYRCRPIVSVSSFGAPIKTEARTLKQGNMYLIMEVLLKRSSCSVADVLSAIPLQCTFRISNLTMLHMKMPQDEVVNWLLENGVDREKQCYHGQKPLDVIGQCRSHAEAESRICKALSAELTSEFFESCRCVLEQKIIQADISPPSAADLNWTVEHIPTTAQSPPPWMLLTLCFCDNISCRAQKALKILTDYLGWFFTSLKNTVVIAPEPVGLRSKSHKQCLPLTSVYTLASYRKF